MLGVTYVVIQNIVRLCHVTRLIIIPLDILILYPIQKLPKLWEIHQAEHHKPKVLLPWLFFHEPLLDIFRIIRFHYHLLVFWFDQPQVSPESTSQNVPPLIPWPWKVPGGSQLYNCLFFRYIVIYILLIIWLLSMKEHPPTSNVIGPERQYNESILSSSRTGSLKSTVVTPQKKSVSFISNF